MGTQKLGYQRDNKSERGANRHWMSRCSGHKGVAGWGRDAGGRMPLCQGGEQVRLWAPLCPGEEMRLLPYTLGTLEVAEQGGDPAIRSCCP